MRVRILADGGFIGRPTLLNPSRLSSVVERGTVGETAGTPAAPVDILRSPVRVRQPGPEGGRRFRSGPGSPDASSLGFVRIPEGAGWVLWWTLGADARTTPHPSSGRACAPLDGTFPRDGTRTDGGAARRPDWESSLPPRSVRCPLPESTRRAPRRDGTRCRDPRTRVGNTPTLPRWWHTLRGGGTDSCSPSPGRGRSHRSRPRVGAGPPKSAPEAKRFGRRVEPAKLRTLRRSAPRSGCTPPGSGRDREAFRVSS